MLYFSKFRLSLSEKVSTIRNRIAFKKPKYYTFIMFFFNTCKPKNYKDFFFQISILGLVTKLSKKLGCYKCTLECTEENRPFYEKFGYVKDSEHYMQLRFRS